ncbi:MAG: hypothetical protein AB202_02230 [Parcubacteria bacterium C7867-007]|nr:MAG: hypothetical protein AB202_02230 [Parcubacteria bacterium C7867-007]
MKQLYSFLIVGALIVLAQPVSADTLAGCPVLSRDLSIGMTDSATLMDVTALQKYLTDTGYLTPGTANGTFGPKTHAAVQAFQRKNGLSAQGYFGPRSRAILQTLGCSSVATNDSLAFVALDVPDSLSFGENGVWILQFSPRSVAPNTLDFNADWGDGTTSSGPIVTTAGSATTTVAYFNHKYKRSGGYKTTFTIVPEKGDVVRVQGSIRVSR